MRPWHSSSEDLSSAVTPTPPSTAQAEAGKAAAWLPAESLERQWQRTISEFSRLLRLTRQLSRRADAGFRFATISDRFQSLEEVQRGLREAGLESSNLVLAVDFTGSNHVTGRASFGGRCLHDFSGPPNPYQQVMEVVGRTLEPFDDDHLIPAFGFGDVTTTDRSCFPFCPDRPCHGLQEVLRRYGEIARKVDLAGPTNFAPVIDRAVDIVRGSGNQYHILLIIGDGQVNSEPETVAAIVRASSHPLSIVMVGVGDGPGEQMRRFDDELPERRFDNFQLVEFGQLQRDIAELKRRYAEPYTDAKGDAYFAMQVLMEIPDQYTAIRALKLLDRPARRLAPPQPRGVIHRVNALYSPRTTVDIAV